MLRLPRHLLRRRKRQLKLLKPPTPILLLGIKSRPRILLRHIRSQLRHLERRVPDMIVRRKFVPIEDGELDSEVGLVPTDVEEEFFVPGGVEGVPDDARAEDFFAEGDDDEGVHVPARACH